MCHLWQFPEGLSLSKVKRGFEICRYIVRMIRKNCAESEIVESMMQEFSLNREQAEDEYRKIMKE